MWPEMLMYQQYYYCGSSAEKQFFQSVKLNQGNKKIRFLVQPAYLQATVAEQGAAKATAGRRRRRSAQQRSCAAASGRAAQLGWREAAPVGHALDAGGKFDGAPRAVVPVHVRAGERAAATR
jgi:hypothetical protein